jgi:excisionase family DNA binding protein
MNIVQHQLLSPAEVAVELRISAPTVYRLISSKQIPAMRIGGQLRVDRDALTRFLHGESEGPE